MKTPTNNYDDPSVITDKVLAKRLLTLQGRLRAALFELQQPPYPVKLSPTLEACVRDAMKSLGESL